MKTNLGDLRVNVYTIVKTSKYMLYGRTFDEYSNSDLGRMLKLRIYRIIDSNDSKGNLVETTLFETDFLNSFSTLLWKSNFPLNAVDLSEILTETGYPEYAI